MTEKMTDTLTNYALNRDVTDRDLLLRIAIAADRTSEAVESINDRLAKGDIEINKLKTTVYRGKWKHPLIWSSGVASFLIGIIEVFKHYFQTK